MRWAGLDKERSMNVVSEEGILNLGRQVLIEEANEVRALADRLGEPFIKAVKLLLSCKGRVVVSGIGKSGHIARKIAATLASTGTPAFFVHAAEAAPRRPGNDHQRRRRHCDFLLRHLL